MLERALAGAAVRATSGAWSPRPADVVARLAAGAAIDEPAVLVAAHPDDETIGAGGRLALFRSLTLIHVTDGAPADGADARRAGFADPCAYRVARAAELGRALQALDVRPAREAWAVPDQHAALQLAALSRRLADAFQDVELVVTHAYEGGHPDHDACAFAVQAGCAMIRRAGRRPPRRLEFAGYHTRGGRRITGAFCEDPGRPSLGALLSPVKLEGKRAALRAYASQQAVTAWFDPAVERYREAPRYAFTRPPPTGACLYDDWGWPLTGARWRTLAARALAELALEDSP